MLILSKTDVEAVPELVRKTREGPLSARPGRPLLGAESMCESKVMVQRLPNGRLRFFYKKRVLTRTAYGTYAVPDPSEDEKTLDVWVDAIVAAHHTSHGSASLARG
jgi:hypothetical protein